jgi:hypothetical protein
MATADDGFDRPPEKLSGFDNWYTGMFVLAIIVSLCCGLIGLIVNAIGISSAKDPKAKANAKVCLIISIVIVIINAIGVVVQFANK